MNDFRIVTAGDSALIVQFDEVIDELVNRRAVALADALAAAPRPGVRDVVPTYRTVAVYFDPLRTDLEAVVADLHRKAETVGELNADRSGIRRQPDPPRDAIARDVIARDVIRIPVVYGGEEGPDLADVAAFGGITEEEVVRLHTSRVYRVFMLGFVPGFAYMGSVEAAIAAPRRAVPRVRVPAGSVGIAGPQTAIYPMETPGGWQLIGRTAVKLFDLSQPNPFLLQAGDAVQFYRLQADTLPAADADEAA